MLKNQSHSDYLLVGLYLMFSHVAESYVGFYVALFIINPIAFLIGGLLYGKYKVLIG